MQAQQPCDSAKRYKKADIAKQFAIKQVRTQLLQIDEPAKDTALKQLLTTDQYKTWLCKKKDDENTDERKYKAEKSSRITEDKPIGSIDHSMTKP